MRILFLYMFPLWGNGSGSFLRELSEELVKRGHEIGIVAPDKRKLKGIKHYSVNPPQVGVFVGHPELPNAKLFSAMKGRELAEIYRSYLKTSLDAIADFKPDCVHVFHTAFLPEIGRFIKAFYGIKFMITTHGSDLAYLVKDRRFIPLIQDANKTARYITAVSDFTRDWYLKIFGPQLARKTSVIMGGVNLRHYKKDPQMIEAINKKYGLKDKKVVLFTGRLTKNKGVIYLVRAAKAIKGTVVIVGDGPERKSLEEEIRKRELKNVVLVGYMNTSNPMFHAFYERSDVYVSPSVWDEPLGLTILEAMAAHTPVIATRKGGVLSMIQDRSNGFLIRPRNSNEIALTVNMLLESDYIREKVGDLAYKTVLRKFTWGKIAERFEKLYLDMKTKEKPSEAGPLDDLVKRIFPGVSMF